MFNPDGKNSISMTVTSTRLLAALRNPKNDSVWKQFHDRYRPPLLSYARSSFGLNNHDAEEVTQAILTTFYQAYRRGAYDRDKGRLRKWLFTHRHQPTERRDEQAGP